MAKANELVVGDVVTLNSEALEPSPYRMTVTGLRVGEASSDDVSHPEYVQVVWLDARGSLKRNEFPSETLTKIE